MRTTATCIVALLLLTACGGVGAGELDAAPSLPDGAELLFRDNFDDDRLDADRWNTCHWWSVDGGCTIASNDELEWYQPGNVVEADGVLRLEARIEDVVATDGTPFGFTSGMVTTGPTEYQGEPKFAFRYGAAEARLRVPRGAEFWPAFWLLPASSESRPEIDIMEMHGDRTQVNTVHLHSFDEAGERASFDGEYIGPDFAADWHTFSVVWAPDRITWFVDGVPTHSLGALDGVRLPDEPLYLVLNLAIDSDATPPLAGPAAFPAALEIDWVQVWQLPDHSS